MVVTLEPCNHQGRTGPCSEALIAAGISRVVVGTKDPDPRVAGAGVERLRRAGVEVIVGAGIGEAIDPSYFHHRRTGRPLVTLKLAATLDGQIAPLDGNSRWITRDEARTDAHLLRAESDAVVVGAGTIRRDDPRLDVRLPGHSFSPRPVIVVGESRLPEHAQIWSREPLLIQSRPGESLAAPLRGLAEQGYLAILVEGGARLARSLWDQGLVDRVVLYLAGRLAGGAGQAVFSGSWNTLSDSRPVAIEAVTRLGPDLRVDLVPA
jgi:diaminohydroxyphosphoribosylaminopyrimidine deaminase / 5-amino-6-(5-phosphoribosylamino)uracil reductase